MNNSKIDTVAEEFLKVFPVVIKYMIMLGDRVSDPEYSYQEYQALHMLKEYGKLPISAVGARFLISKPRMTVMVDKLNAAELIERYPDKKDRRIINIGLTEKGRAFTTIHSQNLKESVVERFKNLTDDDLVRFLDAMAVIQSMMTKTASDEQ